MYSSRITGLCTHGELNDVLIVGGTLVLHVHIYKEAEVIVQGVDTMYNIYLQVLGEIWLQQSETHLDSQLMGLDTDLPAGDFHEFNLIRQSFIIEVDLTDIQGSGHGNGLGEDLTLGSGDVPDVV